MSHESSISMFVLKNTIIMSALSLCAIVINSLINGFHNTNRIVCTAVFFVLLNVISFSVHRAMAKDKEKMLTAFYLGDKIFRLLTSGIFFFFLLKTGIYEVLNMTFCFIVYYIVSMILLMTYYRQFEKQAKNVAI